jgi:hypothetical protein
MMPVMSIAYRGDGSDRPTTIPLPPAKASMFRGFRMRKHWRYLGVWSPAVSICAARVRVGPLAQEFWGIWHREAGKLTEHSRLRAGRVHLRPGGLEVADRQVRIDLGLEPTSASAFEVVTPVGRAWTWTRKQEGRARGTATIEGREVPVDGVAMLEDNDGYHPRLTHWWWAAGAGRLTDGRTAMWNAVVGLNDTLPHIENTVWIDGQPRPIGLVTIAKDLTRVMFGDGSAMRFTEEAERATKIDFFIVRSAYRQPFGTFAGTLPDGLELAEGYGVMEDHRALW